MKSDEEEKDYNWNDTTEIIPTHTRSFVIYLSVLLISLSANILLLLRDGHLQSCPLDLGKSVYSASVPA